MLKPGDKAPDFTLTSDRGEQVSLSDFMGKSEVVLYFYPKDNTSGCTKEACSFRDNIREIETQGAVVLGISPDSVTSHQNFIQKHKLNFTLLSDPEHKVAEVYGAWGEKSMYGKKYWGILRTTFIIGKDGIIKHVFENVKPAGHAEEVLTAL
ncbi:MAG: thioredoxin-dependent thiol peroxidase [candidate division KSB1 bacterium]|nr:thioredoxin-dependent thiol peroxidase [candidate division KSB1 bacterium]